MKNAKRPFAKRRLMLLWGIAGLAIGMVALLIYLYLAGTLFSSTPRGALRAYGQAKQNIPHNAIPPVGASLEKCHKGTSVIYKVSKSLGFDDYSEYFTRRGNKFGYDKASEDGIETWSTVNIEGFRCQIVETTSL
ncbi:MAG TPA: hypothetical protein VK694_03085 [Verrucomicrobiae bacterium]|nr:hypothetical protein [Verrucomicrobiae bacterium]